MYKKLYFLITCSIGKERLLIDFMAANKDGVESPDGIGNKEGRMLPRNIRPLCRRRIC